MRNGIADAVLIAIIVAVSSIVTVIFEKETDNSITNIIYPDANTTKCNKENDTIK